MVEEKKKQILLVQESGNEGMLSSVVSNETKWRKCNLQRFIPNSPAYN